MHKQARCERLRLRVKPEFQKRARKWADRRGKSLSAYIREAIREKMDDDLLRDINAKKE